MARLPDWERRLVAESSALLGQPFAWGENDCAMIAFRIVDAMTGSSLAERFRGRYSSAREALRLQAHERVDANVVLRHAGAVPVARGFQQRGDVLVVRRDGFACAHVCMGVWCLASKPDAGVAWCDTDDVLNAGAEVLRIA